MNKWTVFRNTIPQPGGTFAWGGTFIVDGHTDIAYIPVSSKLEYAYLMSAAPEMLEALVAAKGWMMEEEGHKENMHPHDREVYDKIMTSIDNAIKKATNQ